MDENVMRKLTKKARTEIENLQSSLRAVVERDRTREPKLTEFEKAQVAERKAIIDAALSRLPRLEGALPPLEARLKDLSFNAAEMVAKGGDPLDIAHEYLVLKQAVSILEGALNLTYSEKSQAEHGINAIKDAARNRELIQEQERLA